VRALSIVGLVVLLWPLAGLAQAELSIEEQVDKAVAALKTTCYEARMHFMALHAEGEEQTVHIIHVAPDLYRVAPLREGPHGEWQERGYYFIENADQLVQVYEHDGKPYAINEMPERSFYINDALTIKFLRALVLHPGTVLLEGQLDDTPVHILRQLAFKEKPYTITVGLDQETCFPLYLLVNDGAQERRVFYEMKAIEYKTPDQIDVELLRVPVLSADASQKAPRTNQIAPSAITVHQLEEGESNAQISVQRGASSALASTVNATYALPLYPTWLPQGYQVEGIQLLDFITHNNGDDEPALVYQFLIYGPEGRTTLSIFQTQTDEAGLCLDVFAAEAQEGYLVEQQDDWLVAIFGDLPAQELMRALDSLAQNDTVVRALLEITQSRDRIREQAQGSE